MRHKVLKAEDVIREGDLMVYLADASIGGAARKVVGRTILGEVKDVIRPQPKRDKWHRVEDELPDTCRTVQVRARNFSEIHADTYDGHKWEIYEDNVTHWREMSRFKRPK